jgi:hypothetical protein
MEKRDLLMVVLGLAIVLVVAFVAKPMLTGKPVDMSVPVAIPGIATPTSTPVPTVDDGYARYQASKNNPVNVVPTSAPTTVPSWSGQSKDLGFVDPARYNQNPAPTPIPHTGVFSETNTDATNQMVTYVTIEGKDPGSTEPIPMPFPYWEIRYTVDPWETTPSGGTSGSKAAGVAESFGTQLFPSFSIQVMDADQPNRTVRVITPPGGLDSKYWSKGKEYDPRPWVEKFYEGVENHNYYFVITPHMVHSYRIDVMVPQRYVGKY